MWIHKANEALQRLWWIAAGSWGALSAYMILSDFGIAGWSAFGFAVGPPAVLGVAVMAISWLLGAFE